MSGKKGFFVLAGQPGAGKSFEGARAFQRALAITSAPNNLHYYTKWLESPAGQASGRVPPTRVIMLDRSIMRDSAAPDKPYVVLGPDGLATPLPQKQLFEQLLMSAARRVLTESAAGKPLTYNNVLIDEGGTFWSRIFAEVAATSFSKEGKPDTLKAYRVMGEWSVWAVDLLRQIVAAGANVCFIAHDREPDAPSGKKGGPQMPSQTIMRQVCADADGVLFRQLEDPTVAGPSLDDPIAAAAAKAEAKKAVAKRTWVAHASELWVSKLRGLPDTMFDQIRDMPLEDVLTLAGFEA